MRRFLIGLLRGTPLYGPLKRQYHRVIDRRAAQVQQRTKREQETRRQREVREELERWQRSGCPVPPPDAVKQRTLKAYAGEYGIRTLVETGTYLGDMVEAMRPLMDVVYSIELSDELFAMAQQRFAHAENVRLVHGDSGSSLAGIVKALDAPALFWLDGHYSGGITARGEQDTPILAELETVFGARDLAHVIVIDDARLFGADPAYPTLDELSAFVQALSSSVDLLVKDDMIRITPPQRSECGMR